MAPADYKLDIEQSDVDDAAAAARAAAKRKSRIGTVIMVILGLIIIGALTSYYATQDNDKRVAQSQAQTGERFVDEIRRKCALESNDPERTELNDLGVCKQAAEAKKAIKSDDTATPALVDRLIPGIPGAQGRQGLRGEQGEEGDQGLRGEQGLQGIMGEMGLTGDTGAKGDTGDKGDKGDTGEKGDKGDKGDTGEAGAPGADAPRVVSIGCTGGLTPQTFTFVLSDGSSYDVTCGTLDPVVPPEENTDG